MKSNKRLWAAAAAAAILAIVAAVLFVPHTTPGQRAFLEKADLLKAAVVTDETIGAILALPLP